MSKYRPDLFCPYALTDWIELYEGLIPHVPAEQITTLERDDVLKRGDGRAAACASSAPGVLRGD